MDALQIKSKFAILATNFIHMYVGDMTWVE